MGYGPITVEAAEREMIYDGALNAATMAKLVLALDLKTGAAWAAPNLQLPQPGPRPNSAAVSESPKKPEPASAFSE